MTEAAFPVLGAAFVVLAVLPACALLVKLVLLLLEARLVGGALRYLRLRYILITAAAAAPLAWLLSAALHQVEPDSLVLACLLDHETASLCLEPASFAVLLATGVVLASFATFRRQRIPASNSLRAQRLSARIDRLVRSHEWLSSLRHRVVATERPGFAVGTLGLLRPRVVIGVDFAADLTDSMLTAVLCHEHEHVRSFDPLRYALLELALRVNPFGGWMLRPHVVRWMNVRETQCDRGAVLRGANPLLLAEAILHAARPKQPPVPALGADSLAVLRFRVGLLLAFAERRPQWPSADGRAMPAFVGLLLLAMLLPHKTGTQPLDALHVGIERVVTGLGR